jgi:pyruvate kinase
MSARATPLTTLHEQLEALIDDVRREGALRFEDWGPKIEREVYARSALNLAHYLALRHRDLRSGLSG